MTLWPLWVALILVVVMGLLPVFFPKWRTDPWGAISAAATLITAGAAISIPLIIDSSARATRTADQLNELDRKLVDTLATKQAADRKNGRTGSTIYDATYIKSDPVIQGVVYRILNDYEYICLGSNKGLFITEVVKALRWDALASTWADYRQFIDQHRKENIRQAQAWTECDKWLQANPHPTIK